SRGPAGEGVLMKLNRYASPTREQRERERTKRDNHVLAFVTQRNGATRGELIYELGARYGESGVQKALENLSNNKRIRLEREQRVHPERGRKVGVYVPVDAERSEILHRAPGPGVVGSNPPNENTARKNSGCSPGTGPGGRRFESDSRHPNE